MIFTKSFFSKKFKYLYPLSETSVSKTNSVKKNHSLKILFCKTNAFYKT